MDARRNPSPAATPANGSRVRGLSKSESGWTLIELLIVASLLIVVLTAVLSIADGTQKTAAADQERTNTIGDAQVGIARIADDLRNACLMFGANGTGSTGSFCRQTFTVPPGTSACARSSDCIDMIVDRRTGVARPSGTTTRSLLRVRIDCGTADPGAGARTQCARYAGPCSTSSCLSPTALTGVLVRSVTNGGAAGSPTNVFVYCASETISSAAGAAACSATPATANAVQISLAVARKGPRVSGGAGSFFLQDGADLKNANVKASS